MCLNLGVGSLIRKLRSTCPPEVREQAIRDLVKVGGLAIDILIDFLSHHDPSVRRGVIKALGEIGLVSAIEPLLEARSKETENIVPFIDEALAKIRNKTEDY